MEFRDKQHDWLMYNKILENLYKTKEQNRRRDHLYTHNRAYLFFQLNDGSNFKLTSTKRDDNGEPDCIVQWKLQQAERIQIKDKEEEEKMKEMREKAKKDLEDW